MISPAFPFAPNLHAADLYQLVTGSKEKLSLILITGYNQLKEQVEVK